MLNQPMMEKLLAMRLQGMVEGLKTQQQDRAINELSFLERLALLVDQQWSWRENQALARRLKAAKLRGPACVEDIDYRAARGLDKTVNAHLDLTPWRSLRIDPLGVKKMSGRVRLRHGLTSGLGGLG
jgi:DNA replication protein DnaC